MRRVLILIAAVLMTACASSPPMDTINKKMAAFEISYQETIKFAIQLRSDGRLSDDAQDQITSIFHKIDLTRDAAYASMGLGDVIGAQDHITLSYKLLTLATNILKELEKREIPDEQHNSSSRVTYVAA